ncbi:hypothetical protein OLX02_03595 [Novosphingobium sp. KCTC 2891]|uniref:hypothetical protein n=1 Tax=Novosphingobium sp. KCTC 2891 TaxID=2989730 RepID=UPI002223E345|nr:hypothetical protein [Novosphingobium sp. KCTC 2891]MCW1381898.1 hypothetical protein [Novosphingobium sp. KCTC 2891]
MQLKSLFSRTAPVQLTSRAPPPDETLQPPSTPAPSLPGSPPKVRLLAEMAVVFSILLGIDHTFFAGHAYAGVEPNPYWLPVLLMATCYGSGAGLSAAIVATAIWVTAPAHGAAGDHLQRMLSLSILPMLWVIAALLIGEITSNRLTTIRKLARHRNKLQRDQHKLAETISDLAQTNRRLQVRIVTEERTVGDAVAAAIHLVEAGPAKQVAGIERLIALAAGNEAFTFYTVRDQQLMPLFRGSTARSDLSWGDLIERFGKGGPASDGQAIRLDCGELILPVYADGDPVLCGVLALESMSVDESVGKAVASQAMLAELQHVAQSLARLGVQLQQRVEPLPLPMRPWLMTRENAA